MGPANTDLIEGDAGYNSSSNSYTTTFSTAPNALSGNCLTQWLTSEGGHPDTQRCPISTKDIINQETLWASSTTHQVQSTTYRGPSTSKGGQSNRPQAYFLTHRFTNYCHGQCNQSVPGGKTAVPSPVSLKYGNACTKKNIGAIITILPTLQAPEVFAHMEHILRQWTRLTMLRFWRRIKSPQQPLLGGHEHLPHHYIWIYSSINKKRNLPLHGCVWGPTSKIISQSYTHHHRW